MERDPEHTWGHALPFSEEYYRETIGRLRKLRAEAEIFAGVAHKAAESLRAGGKVYTDAAVGHMPPAEMDDEREGNPAQIHCVGWRSLPEDYAALSAGDVLFTSHVNTDVRQARDAGVFVVGLLSSYIDNRTTPPGKVLPCENDWLAEDVSSVVIDTHMPWDQGVVRIPQVPEMPVFPVSSNLACSIHWMLTAEVARALASGDQPDGTAGREYLDILFERLDAVHREDMEDIGIQAVVVAKRIIGGGRFFVRSRNGGVQGDAHGVAQGLKLTNAFEMRAAAEGGDRDTFVIAAVSADDPQELEWAEQARANGNHIIGIGPANSDALRQQCDVYFSNRCAEAAGVIEVAGMAESICPVTGILNNIILHLLTAQFVDEMCRRGAVPYFYMGLYRTGGSEYNALVEDFFQDRGY